MTLTVIKSLKSFLSRVSNQHAMHAERNTVLTIRSLRLSVCLSSAGWHECHTNIGLHHHCQHLSKHYIFSGYFPTGSTLSWFTFFWTLLKSTIRVVHDIQTFIDVKLQYRSSPQSPPLEKLVDGHN